MKVRLSTVVIALSALTVAGAAHSQQTQPSGTADQTSMQQTSTQQQMQTDRGGTWDYGAQSGGRNGYGKTRNAQPCVVGLSCDIYQSP